MQLEDVPQCRIFFLCCDAGVVVKVFLKFRPDNILSLLTLIRCENKFELINVDLDDGVTGVFAAGVQQPELLPWFQTHAINGTEFSKSWRLKKPIKLLKPIKASGLKPGQNWMMQSQVFSWVLWFRPHVDASCREAQELTKTTMTRFRKPRLTSNEWLLRSKL